MDRMPLSIEKKAAKAIGRFNWPESFTLQTRLELTAAALILRGHEVETNDRSTDTAKNLFTWQVSGAKDMLRCLPKYDRATRRTPDLDGTWARELLIENEHLLDALT
jgi:hypothetical protein